MKNLLYSFLVGSIFLASCDKKMSPGKTTTTSVELIPFNQKYVSENNAPNSFISSTWFYNSSEIRLSLSATNKDLRIENHGWVSVDSILNRLLVVKTRTTGQPLRIQRNPDPLKVDYLEIQFDNSEAVFNIWFRRSAITGEFELFSNGILKYRGETYQVTTSSVKPCILLFSYTGKTIPVNDKKEARGVDGSANSSAPSDPSQKSKGNNDLPQLKEN